MYTVQNDASGETLTFTDEQAELLRKASPDWTTLRKLNTFLIPDTTAVLNSDGFYFVCYHGMRAWLGISGEDESSHQA